jgi:tRNA (guanine-N7-)-methyltransferase
MSECLPFMSASSQLVSQVFPPAENLSEIMPWRTLFGSDRPVEIDVGCGKGLFLVTAGAERTGTDFLGIEASRKYALLSARRVAERGLDNVHVVVADARVVLSAYVPRESVQAVHVYFPDPWWKRRHRGRRVLNELFLHDVERAVVPGGQLHVWTDVEEYFRTTQELIRRHTGLRPVGPAAEREPQHDMDYQSNFERKMRRRGRCVFRALYRKGP